MPQYQTRGDNGKLLTSSLFYEQWCIQPDEVRQKHLPVFSFAYRDGYIHARTSFLEFKDPTGVKWALKYLEGVHHLDRLRGTEWFSSHYDQWVGEVEQLLQSEALSLISAISKGNSPAAFQAAKFIAGKAWKGSKGRGRPSKQEVALQVKKEAERLSQEESDYQRVVGKQLTVVQGGKQ